MVSGINTSSDLNWLITRNSSCYLMKRRGVNHHFSTDPLNPKGLYKPRFQGTIQRRALTVREHPTNRGVYLVYKKRANQNKPFNSINCIVMNRNAKRTLRNIKQFVNKQNYRNDLKNVVLRKASALLRSQRVKNTKKTRQSKKKE